MKNFKDMKKILLTTLTVMTALMASAGNIWTGNEVIDWNNGKAVSISSEKFQNVKEGDQLVFGIVFTGNTDWPQIALYKGDWSGNLTGAGNTALAEGMTEVKYFLLKDMISDLKATGLIIAGVGFTLTSVDVVEGDGGDYSHAVWVGECKIGNWDGYQLVDKGAFAHAAVGQKMRVKFKDLGAGAYLSLRNPVNGWPDLSDAPGVYISGNYHQFDVTAAMLSELKASGMVISGVNFTATAVELWNADEIKPLILQVPVTSNWVFEGNAVPTFNVSITNPYSTAMEASINMEVSTDKMAPVTSVSKTVTIQGNNAQRIEEMTAEGLQPGIYHATITVNDDLARGFYFAVKPTEIVSAPDKQSDFDSYWAAAKAQLAAVPINATLTEIPAKSSDKRKVYLVEMQSIADGLSGDPVIIRGYYAEPQDGKKHPVLIHFQGYDSEYRPGGDSAIPWCMNANWDTEESANWAEFILSNRGQSVNNRPASGRDDGIQEDFVNIYGDWFAYEFGNKDKYYYRGAYMDCLRAIDFMASRETSDMQNLFAEGGSQGGAFTVAAAALSDHKFNAIAPSITFMGDFPDYFEIVSWPSYVAKSCQAEINNNGGSMTDADMYAFLSYYDTKNLATSIDCPLITSVGLQDNVCPPHTNLASYNNVQTTAADKQVVFNAELQHAVNSEWTTTYQSFFRQYLTATPITQPSSPITQHPSPIYDLQGRQVTNPEHGIYIKNGRKYMSK